MIEQHTVPRGLLHPGCDTLGHPSEGVTCEDVDQQKAWVHVVNAHAVNADMLVDADHTAESFVWSFDRGEV